MVARINTVAFSGVSVQPIDVQVQISNGLPNFTIVGLPDKAVAESKERVRAALHALGIAHVTFPARFQLVAAMNPCRCGYLGDPESECTKAPRCGSDYQARLSGPLLDRIDLQVEVGAVQLSDLSAPADGEDSQTVAARVARARGVQRDRYTAFGVLQSGIHTNAQAGTDLIDRATRMEEPVKTMFVDAAERLKLSARAYYRLLKVALTLSDMDGGHGDITKVHVAEALSYRRLRNV
jgi:magnesium chelatase family protein